MIYLETVLYGVDVIVGTACLLPALNHTVNQFIFRNLKPDYMMQCLASTAEKAVKGISLWNRAGESVENHPVLCLWFVIKNFLKNTNHK